MKKYKKLILGLALAAGLFFAVSQPQQAEASTREQGTDLSVYQGYSAIFGRASDKFAISQIGGYYDGQFVVQPTYHSQVTSTIAQGKRAHTYIYSQFSNNWQADQMLNYYLPRIQTPKGSIVALDVESGHPNVSSILYALNRIQKAGFTAMLYTSPTYANAHFNLHTIAAKYPLWLAEYPDYQVRLTPNYSFFPSFENIAIFQFTSTYRAGGLDGNVDLTGITKSGYKGYTKPSTGGKVPVPNNKTPAINHGQQANKTPKSAIKVGNTVKVNYSARRWANGAGMPSWVHGKSYKVIQVSGNKVLLGGIMSWINKSDIELTLKTSAGSARPARSNGQVYTVRYGDTVSGIASRYGTTVAKIKSLNGLRNANYIYVGQRLKISGSARATSSSRAYYVTRGDTLSGIAAKLGSSISRLQARNGIRNANLIYPGQKLSY